MHEFFAYAAIALPDMLRGTLVTLEVTAGSLLIGLAVGLPMALIRVYGGKLLQPLCTAYLTVFRGTPLLVQLFVIYYGLPEAGISFSRMGAAFFTLGCNSAAYQCEYFRGALLSVSLGQMKAARAIGMSGCPASGILSCPRPCAWLFRPGPTSSSPWLSTRP